MHLKVKGWPFGFCRDTVTFHGIVARVPFNDCPHKSQPGYVTSRRCRAPCGGWCVLFDRVKGALPQLEMPVAVTGRYIIFHDGSSRWAGLNLKRKDALEVLKATARGEDVYGILAGTLPENLQPPGKAALEMPAPAPGGEAPPSDGSNDVSRARETSPSVPDSVAVQRALNEAFTAERIVSEFEAGLSATKGFVVRSKTKDGMTEDLVEVADHATRVRYLEVLAKFRIGSPLPREKAAEPKRVTYAQLQQMAASSPATRKALRQMVEQAEAAAAVPPLAAPAEKPKEGAPA